MHDLLLWLEGKGRKRIEVTKQMFDQFLPNNFCAWLYLSFSINFCSLDYLDTSDMQPFLRARIVFMPVILQNRINLLNI